MVEGGFRRLLWNRNHFAHPPRLNQEPRKKNRQDAAANGEDAPHPSFPRSGYGIGWDYSCGRRVILGPDCNGAGVIALDLAPAAEDQERFIERIVHKNELETVVVAVLQHGAE